MKSLKKIFSLLITVSLIIALGMQSVSASSYPSSIKVSSIGKINYGGTYSFPVKYTSDGTLAYCTEYQDQFPMGVTMSNPARLEPGISYIIANGYKGTKGEYGNDSKMKQYYITQLAIYTYLGQANPKNNNAVHKAVWDLVNKAKSAKANDVTLNVSLSSGSTTMKLTSDKKYFISEAITVKSNVASQSFSVAASQNVGAFVVNANGTKVSTVKSGDKVYIKVPSDVIKEGQKITLSMSVKGSRTKQAAYLYKPSQSKIQNITPGVTYPKTETASASIKVNAKKDKITTKVKISKQDITTKKELPGAKLVIKDASGNVKASWTSTNEPKYIEGLAAGNYTLCETQAPSGYKLKTECIKFTVKADGTVASVVMYNEKKPTVTKVKISKRDITTKNELPGAKLVIKDASGNVKASWTSTNEPKYIEGLAAGNYTLCETQAPDGYKLQTECIKFTVKADGTVASVVMYNEKKPTVTKVKISKKDITTKEELPGAKLVIKDANGKVVESWTSTSTPKYIEGLKAGNYTLCETQAPNGYKLETECIKFTVKANGSVSTVVMYNEKKPTTTKVKISKKDITTKEELPGAKLVIKDAKGNVKASWTSTSTPKYIEGLTEGTYTLCETQAPSGYKLETECIDFKVKADGTVTTVVMYNEKKPTTTKVKISKRDITTKEELPGAKLVIKDANGNVKASWTSTNEPKYIEGLAAGNYTLCETQAPDGYKLETECIKFTVKTNGTVASVIMYNEKKPTVTKVKISKQDITNKKELPGAKLVVKDAKGNVKASWTSTSTPKYIEGLEAGTYYLTETAAPEGYELYTESIKFNVYANGTVSKVIMYNSPKIVTKVKISKQDITTKKELPGASLVIKDASGKVVESWVSTNEPKYIEGLKAGNYTLCETAAPQGYELYTECIKFAVKENGTLSTVIMYNTPKKEEAPKKTKLQIIKKDATTKEVLEGATFVLKDSEGKVVETWKSTKKAKEFENLKAGTYTLTETEAPEGYILNTKPMTFELKANDQLTTVIMYNTKKPTVTKVKISKQDITTKEELPGAKLVIKNAEGKVVESWTSTNEPKYIEGLETGKYTLCETQAPEGYVLATECINFEVKADGSITSVIMYNTKQKDPEPEKPEVTKVQISKQDMTTKEELPGATLVIKDASGKVIETWVSTNEPKYIEGLKEGNYTLCETQAPEGYVLATECVNFTVKADGSITKAVMYNEKQPTKEEPKVYKTKVSKQDITTKEELPGATLVIKNSEGVEIHRFVSGNTPTYFELQPGTYTLTEVQAPNGYILSTEEITFTVSEDHTIVTEVVMYNTRAVDVPITASSVSMLVYVIGLLGIAFGFKTVFVNARI